MNPGTSTPTAAPKRVRRKQARPGELLDAALTLFVEKGYAASRVEEVAACAGVSKGTLFLYFPSKEALFQAVVSENIGRHLHDALQELDAFTGPSGELLHTFMRRWWTEYGDTPAAGLTKLIMGEASNFPDLAQHYQEQVVQPSHELLRRIVQRGVDRGEFRAVDLKLLSHLIVAPLVHLVMWRLALAPCTPRSEAVDPLAFIDLHAEMVVRGLRQEPALT